MIKNFGDYKMKRQKQLFFLVWMLLVTLAVVGCGGGGAAEAEVPAATPTSSGNSEMGKTLFIETCSSCHGQDALGISGLGKDLTTSTFIHSQSDEQLLAFLKVGRPVSDPLNTTGVDMPPKGGNPALDDTKLLDIIAFLRSIGR